MKKTFKNFTLYITKKDDTIETIAKKFGCNVDDIYRYNKMIRYHNIFPGMPLHIVIPSEERKIIEEKQDNISPIYAYDNIWYYRSSLVACLYSPFSADILIEKEKKNLHMLFSFFPKQSQISLQIESFIAYLHDSNEILAKCIEKNTLATLKNEMESKKKKCTEYKKYLQSFDLSEEWTAFIDLLLELDKSWQSFIIQYASKKAKEAETLFENILEKEIILYQKLFHFIKNEKKE